MVAKAADDTNFANAKVSFDKKNTAILSDDSLVITDIASGTNISKYSIVVSKNGLQNANVGDCELNLQGDIPLEEVSSGKATISSTNFKNKVYNLEVNNNSVYVNIYVNSGADGKCLVKTNVYTETPNRKDRFSEAVITVDHKNTVSLDDDLIKVSGVAELPSNHKFMLCASVDKYADPSPAAATITTDNCAALTKSGDYLTIVNTHYKTIAGANEYFYLTITEEGDLFKDSVYANGAKTSIALKDLKGILTGAKTTNHSSIELQFIEANIANPEIIMVRFSTKEDTKDINEVHKISTADGTSFCVSGVQLEKVADKKYGLKNYKNCILKYLEKKTDTYVTLYRVMSRDEYNPCPVGASACDYPDAYFAKKITESTKVPRPNDLAVGGRIAMSITPDGSLFFYNSVSATDKKATYSIGAITDKELLRNLRDNASGANDALLEYAKKAEAINQGQVTIKANEKAAAGAMVDGGIYSQTEIHAGEYYFVYLKTDGDTYYPVEDVQVFGATKNTDGKIELVERANIEWTGLTESTTKPKKNPGTGIASYTLLALTISAIALTIYIKTRKVTKFPQS